MISIAIKNGILIILIILILHFIMKNYSLSQENYSPFTTMEYPIIEEETSYCGDNDDDDLELLNFLSEETPVEIDNNNNTELPLELGTFTSGFGSFASI